MNVIVLFANGRIGCFGSVNLGIIGRDQNAALTLTTSLVPIAFRTTHPAIYVSISHSACAVFSNRKIRCWGSNSAGLLGLPVGATALASIGSGNAITASVTVASFISFAPSINTIPVIQVSVGV